MSLKKILKVLFYSLPIKVQCFIESLLTSGRMSVGSKSYIHPSVHVIGKNNVFIGNNVCVSEGTWLNVNHRIKGKFSIKIGDYCFIGKRNFFTSGDLIEIGSFTLTTIECKFIGSSHNIHDPQNSYLLSGTTGSDRIKIGVNCFIGAGATVLGNVKIGHGSVIASGAIVLKDIPPFSMAVGNPAKVIKRYSFKRKAWVSLSKITDKDEMAMPSEQDYLVQLRAKYPIVNMPWIAAGKSLGDL